MHRGLFNQAESTLTFIDSPSAELPAGETHPVEYLRASELGNHATILRLLEGITVAQVARSIGSSAAKVESLGVRETSFEALGMIYEAVGSKLFLGLSLPEAHQKPVVEVELFAHTEEADLKAHFTRLYQRGGTQKEIGESLGYVASSVDSFRKTKRSRPSSLEKYFSVLGLHVGFFALAGSSSHLALPEGLYRGVFNSETSILNFSTTAPSAFSTDMGYCAECIPISDFGSQLSTRRIALGMSRIDLAESAGVEASAVAAAETDQASLRSGVAGKLYRAVGGRALFLAVFPKTTDGAPEKTMELADASKTEPLQEWFKAILNARGITREEIARQIGVQPGVVSQVYGPGRRLPVTIEKYFSPLGYSTAFCGIKH